MRDIVQDKLRKAMREAMLDNGVPEYGVDQSVEDIIGMLDQDFNVSRRPIRPRSDPFDDLSVWSVRSTGQLILSIGIVQAPLFTSQGIGPHVVHTPIPCSTTNLQTLAGSQSGHLGMELEEWSRIHRYEGPLDGVWLPSNLTERCDSQSGTLFIDSF